MSEIYNWEDEEDWILAPVLEKITPGQLEEMKRILDMTNNMGHVREIIPEYEDEDV